MKVRKKKLKNFHGKNRIQLFKINEEKNLRTSSTKITSFLFYKNKKLTPCKLLELSSF